MVIWGREGIILYAEANKERNGKGDRLASDRQGGGENLYTTLIPVSTKQFLRKAVRSLKVMIRCPHNGFTWQAVGCERPDESGQSPKLIC